MKLSLNERKLARAMSKADITHRVRITGRILLAIITLWIILTIIIYNVMCWFPSDNPFLSRLMLTLSEQLPVLDLIASHSPTPLPRQIAQLCILFWTFFLLTPAFGFILYTQKNTEFFCYAVEYQKRKIARRFIQCLFMCPLGIFGLSQFILLDRTSDMSLIKKITIDILFIDSNMAILLSFFLALGCYMFIFAGIFILGTFMYIFNKQYRNDVNRQLDN